VTGEPPKKKRLSAAEKAARTQATEDEKRKKSEERDKKKREKEEAERLKAEQKAKEKAARAAEKVEKDNEKKQEKEKRKREKEEEEAKKTRSQMKLTSMFGKGQPLVKPQTREETNPAGATGNGAAKETSLYDQMFRPFFVKEHVRLANNPSELDDETREAKAKILDEYIQGEREEPTPEFNPLEALQIPYKSRRGRVYPSVRKIMAEFNGLSKPADATTESQNAQIRQTREALKLVPVKSIKFKDNVRPPYIGTISGPPPGGKSLRKLARKPTSRDILELNYDYDSEAEWQEEEGEDVDELDDEEEEEDLDEEMAGFLDDSEDVGPARMILEGGMEPESSGLCWEGYKRCNTQPKMYKHRLEFIHGKPSARASSRVWLAKPTTEPLEHHHSIDPFSTAYWAPPPKSKADAKSTKSAAISSADLATSVPAASKPSKDARGNLVTPNLSDAFQALTHGAPPVAAPKKSQQLLPPAMQEALKELVTSRPTLSKVGVVEWFASEHPECSKTQIKVSFAAMFEKSGKVFKVKGE
jgi:chromatin assembly factor 1 subunit A